MVDWALLRSFLAVMEAGSLSAAASQSATIQPTLSRHVRELEAALGVTLFTRSARGLDPTEAALGLVNDARAMGAAADALALKAQGRSQQLTGTVRITASVVAHLLPPVLAALRRAEPNIQVEIVASDLAQNLLRRDADVAIRMVEPTQNTLIARKLGETPLGLFGTRDVLARHDPIRTVDGLLACDVIGFDRSDAMLKAFAAQGYSVARENFPVRCDDRAVYWHLLLAGAGLGFVQVLLARRHPELVQVDIGLRLPVLPVWLVMHEEVRSNARIRRVADALAAALVEVLQT